MEMKILVFCLSFFELCINSVTARDPPSEDSSYGAVGEIIIQYDSDDVVATMFEENFDYDNHKAVFTVRTLGFSSTLLEDMYLNQTYKYDEIYQEEDDKVVQTCQLYESTEWRKIHIPPDLELFEKGQQTVFFPLMQLLWGLSPNNKKPGTEVTTKYYRDIPCDMWLYQLNYTTDDGVDYVVEVEAYWSNGDWNTSAKENVVPVGFIISHDGLNKSSGARIKTKQYVNVMHFTKDHFDKEAFLPKEGIYCPGRKSDKPFPSFGDLTGVSASIEFQWKGQQVDSSVDIMIDTTGKVVEVHYDPFHQAPNIVNRRIKVSSILISSYEDNIAYDIRGDSCQVMWTKEVVDDVQTLYSIQELSELTIDHFFGHGVNYVYIGETVKRGIPCRLWQGQRRGWPRDEPSITTVWEWCILERRDNPFLPQDTDTIPIVNLDITVTESHLTAAMGIYTLGTKFSYSFYHLVARKPSYLRLLGFDISPCFNDSYKEWLQFKVDVKSMQNAVKNATANADFLALWRDEIYGATGIRPASLRVPKIKAILAENALFLQFLLLEVHPGTPAFVAKDANIDEAKRRLNSTINDDGLYIDWQNVVLRAQKGSLGPIFQITKPPDNYTTKEPGSSSSTISTTATDEATISKKASRTTTSPTQEDSTSFEEGTTTFQPISSTGTIDSQEEQRSMKNRYSSGTMGGLGFGMLIVGISLGAGGTFAKFRYFPNLW